MQKSIFDLSYFMYSSVYVLQKVIKTANLNWPGFCMSCWIVGNVLAPPYANNIVPKASANVDMDVGLECIASSEASGICNNTVTKSNRQPHRAVNAAQIAIHLKIFLKSSDMSFYNNDIMQHG